MESTDPRRMGASWTRLTPSMLGVKFQNLDRALKPAEYEDVMLNAMREVQVAEVAQAKQYTNTRGTEKSGKAGRVETGRMVDAIAGETFKSGRRGNEAAVTNRVGFIHEDLPYFDLQTVTGFSAGGFRPASYVAPTLALKDARQDSIDNLHNLSRVVLDEVRKNIRSALA